MQSLWVLRLGLAILLTGWDETASAAGWYLNAPPPPPLLVRAPPPVIVVVPPPPPPPAPPPLPPPPPMPPQPKIMSFSVFYDFDKANLTAQAQAAIADIVQIARSVGFSHARITGHADTVGSESYNQGLSLERAKSVRDEMVSDGMDVAAIAIAGRGFHEPLMSTDPGVRVPPNRRAVIDLLR